MNGNLAETSLVSCPDEPTLADFLAGRLTDGGLQSVAAHLDKCASCVERIRTLEPNSDSLAVQVRGRPGSSPFVDESACREGLARVNALRPRLPGLDALVSSPLAGAVDATADSVGYQPGPIEEALVGRRIGPYEIRRYLASGGMGSVYGAVRVDDYRQQVAIKVIRGGSESQEMLSRFARERQILAELEHPQIARLLDGGTTDDGRPFYVMEYIEGRRIDHFCDEEQVPLRGRVELFLQVCDAVAHAHDQGIVHRDLKPANVMVTTAGVPKLTDFGVAKFCTPAEDQTHTGNIVGTPRYMAPEQARGRADELGPLCDEWSLGAVLYELITAHAAFQGADWQETLQLACTQEPVAPRRLDPTVPRDLETICLKCLRQEPHRRYEDVAALADDLRRFLEGRPISARPAGRVERAARWCRRSPLAATAIGVACLSLLTGALTASVFALRLHGALQETEQARSDESGARNLAEDRQRDATQQAAIAEARGERLRRLLYNSQLRLVQNACDSNPTAALQWLEDIERCPPDLRNFAWKHLRLKSSRRLWTASADGQDIRVDGIAFSPDGRSLATSGPRVLRLWETASGERVGIRANEIVRGHCLAYSPDSSLIAVASGDFSIRLLKVAGAHDLARLEGHTVLPLCAAFSQDGALLAAGARDGRILVWDVAAKQLIATLAEHDLGVKSLGFARDGTLISFGGDAMIRHWNIAAQETVRAIELVIDPRCWADFTGDARALSVGEVGGRIVVVDSYTGESLKTFETRQGITPIVAYSNDGSTLAATIALPEGPSGNACIWNAQNWEELLEWNVPGLADLTCSANGSLVATTANVNGRMELSLWDTRPGRGTITLQPVLPAPRQSVAWLPDGRLLCAGADTMAMVNPRQEYSVEQFARFGQSIQAVSANGTNAGVALEFSAHIWDAESGEPAALIAEYEKRVLCTAFAPDGSRLAVGASDGSLLICDTAARKMIWRIRGTWPVCAVAFTPDGRTLISAGRDAKVSLHDFVTGQVLTQLDGHAREICALAVSPNGRWLASAGRDHTVRLWNLEERRCVSILTGHTDAVTSLDFSPDGRTLASGSRDDTIRLWDPLSGDGQIVLKGHSDGVQSVAFSPDGTALASISRDGVLKVWLTESAE